MQELDDKSLLDEYARRGSQEAFAALVSRHLNKVYSVAMRHTGNPHQAEEIAQAVFVILARKAAGIGERVPLEGWLFETARLTSLTFIRGEIRRTRREQEAFMQSGPNEPDSDVWKQIAPLLDSAMASLNDTDRRAVVLRFFYGKSMSEVGAALGSSEGTANVRLHRAVEKLRQFFARRGVASTTDALTNAIAMNCVLIAPPALAKSITAAAMTKGIASGSSTSTLIKGALKLMAWTKMKTAVVTGAVALCFIGTATVTYEATAPSLQGTWETSFSIPGAGIRMGESPHQRLVLKVSRTNGGYQVLCDNIDKGIKDIEFTNVKYKYHSIHAGIPIDKANFDATVNLTGTAISGTIKAGKYTFPMVFKRTSRPSPFPEPLADDEFVPRAGSALQGYWQGAISIPAAMASINHQPQQLKLNIKIAEPSDGTYRADFFVPQQSDARQPAQIGYDGTIVKIMPMTGMGMFEGTLQNGNAELVGNWIQGGAKLHTTLTRAN